MNSGEKCPWGKWEVHWLRLLPTCRPFPSLSPEKQHSVCGDIYSLEAWKDALSGKSYALVSCLSHPVDFRKSTNLFFKGQKHRHNETSLEISWLPMLGRVFHNVKRMLSYILMSFQIFPKMLSCLTVPLPSQKARSLCVSLGAPFYACTYRMENIPPEPCWHSKTCTGANEFLETS